jgi:hypothetical protein
MLLLAHDNSTHLLGLRFCRALSDSVGLSAPSAADGAATLSGANIRNRVRGCVRTNAVPDPGSRYGGEHTTHKKKSAGTNRAPAPV